MHYPTFTAALTGVALLMPFVNALPATDITLTPRGPDSVNASDSLDNLERRQGFGDDLLMAFLTGLASDATDKLKEVMGVDSPPNCCSTFSGTCLMAAGRSKNGWPFQVCYNPGSNEIYDYDVSAMQCVTSLHHTQAAKCISVKGSSCAPSKSGIMNGHSTYLLTTAYDPWNKLDDGQNEALQAAAASMLGVKIDYAQTPNAAIQLMTLKDDQKHFGIGLDFVGHQGTEC